MTEREQESESQPHREPVAFRARVKELFHAASAMDAERRAAFMAVACRDEPDGAAIAEEVCALLGELTSMSGFLDGPTGLGGAMAASLMRDGDRRGEGVGSTIGHYKLLERIGEGGFGEVYMAQQEQPLRRRVALKIIKLGMDTNQVIARFEQERQALAMMDHPHIAKVLDAGATPAGRPYFVMELVRGEPITDFCDARKMDIPQRLELFAQVCEAVQHAHQKGIIHRDLKPSNVLVTIGDGDRPMPKVIDFGIAKATQGRLTERTLFTEFRQMIGTPAYMSPEQAGMGGAGGLDIDTRSDVYALGALLYEILTGETPFDAQRLRSAAFDEIQRIIREDEPPRPSTRVSTSRSLAAVAAHRCVEPRRLGSLVRGELDWVVMRCLEKDRARRYASADDVARDLRRYLAQQPLEAGPPSTAYRMRKFMRRNRRGVTVVATLVVALLLGLIGTTVGALWALEERDLARQSEERAVESQRAAESAAAAESALREVAERETAGNRAVTEFLTRILSLTHPGDTGRSDITVLEVLIGAESEIDEALAGQPLAEGRVRLAIGRAYLALSEFERAEPTLRRAAALLDEHDPENLWDRFEAHRRLADAASNRQTGGMAEITRAMEIGATIIGRSHPPLGAAMSEAVAAVNARQLDRMIEAADRVLELAPLHLAAGDRLWILAIEPIWIAGAGAHERRRFDVPVRFMQAILTLTADHPQFSELTRAVWRTELGMSLDGAGRSDDAETEVRAGLADLRRILHEEHEFVAGARAKLARILMAQGRDLEAVPLLDAACAHMIRRGRLFLHGEQAFADRILLLERLGLSDDAGIARGDFARLIATDRATVAWPLARTAFAPERDALVSAAEELRIAMARPASDAEIESRYAAVGQHWRDVRAIEPAESDLIATYLVSWSDSHERVSADLRRRMCVDAKAALDETDAGIGRGRITALRELHKHALRTGEHEAAVDFARQAGRACAALWGDHFWWTILSQRELGTALRLQGRFAEAETLLIDAVDDLRRTMGVSHATGVAVRDLLRLYADAADHDGAVGQLPIAARLFGDLDAGLPQQDDQVDRNTPGLCATILDSRHPRLGDALRALRTAPTMAAVDAVLDARRMSGPADDDPAALAYASLIVNWPAEWGDSPSTGSVAPPIAAGAHVALLADAGAILRTQVGELAWLTIHADWGMSRALLSAGRVSDAEAHARAHTQRIARSLGESSWTTVMTGAIHARALLELGRVNEAQEVMLDLYPRQEARNFTAIETREGFRMLLEIAADRVQGAPARVMITDSLGRIGSASRPVRRDYARYVGLQRGLPESVYLNALSVAKDAMGETGGDFLSIIGIAAAKYRTGAYEACVATLDTVMRASDLQRASRDPDNSSESSPPTPSEVALAHLFLAMAHQALGEPAQASAHLSAGRALVEEGSAGTDASLVLAEAGMILR